MLYAIQNTRKYFKDNKNKFDNEKLFRYTLRRRIMQVGREKRKILMQNIEMGQSEIKKVLAEQFQEIKKFYVNIN
jgi:hypothetical protein